VKTVSFLVFIVLSQRRNREYDSEGVCVCMCVIVYVRACGRHVGTTASESS